MASEEDKKGAEAPNDEGSSVSGEPVNPHAGNPETEQPNLPGSEAIEHEHTTGGSPTSDQPGNPTVTYSPTVDNSYGTYDDPYGYNLHADSGTEVAPLAKTSPPAPPAGPPPPPSEDEEDEEDEGMLRMSFMGHLEDLRTRLIRMVAGLAVAFVVCLSFSEQLWNVIRQPAVAALTSLGINPPNLVMLSPMDGFTIIWMKLPLLCSIFVASPWILYQVWAFVAPGLYKKERRFAVPFVLCSAGLFCLGGTFAYFVAFRFGLTFLLGIGHSEGVTPFISVVEYFDLFVNIILGIGIVFELPILIFFLTLLKIASPGFLLSNSRYAILMIVILAAIVTPTPDIFNMMIFAVPMIGLFFVGVFASYVLTLRREKKKFPWLKFTYFAMIALVLLAAVLYVAILRYGYKLVLNWPFLVR
jgi:sec-independent protein translocase protein TatC